MFLTRLSVSNLESAPIPQYSDLVATNASLLQLDLHSNFDRTMDLPDQSPPLVPPSDVDSLNHELEPHAASSVSDVVPSRTNLPKTQDAPTEAGSTDEDGVKHLEVSALSDVGCIRTNNEDCFGFSQAHGLFIVCDGMGGMASGEVASAITVATVLRSYADSVDSEIPVSTRLLQAIVAANSAVWLQGQSSEHKGMGTTIVAAAVDGNKLVIGNVGDSRAYLLEAGHCIQLTVDHSYINELIRNGTLTLENARNADLKGMQSVITRAIGATDTVQPDFFSVDLKPGTTLLLATDGLTRYLLQDEIVMVLNHSPFDSACLNLIQIARERGGVDNITCLLMRIA